MSGHSKWSTIKRKKEIADAKRGNVFTKLAKTISVAAREGADPDSNFKLRMAIDKARAFSMPKENIQRAIDKGSGSGEGAALERIVYEAYGPDGVALIIDAVTDNKNRTVSEIKHILMKHNGSLGASGSVLWQFTLKGVITLNDLKLNDELELKLIDLGAADISGDGDSIRVITPNDQLQTIKNKIQEAGLSIADATLEYISKDTVTTNDSDKILELMEALDDHDDVNYVYTNADL